MGLFTKVFSLIIAQIIVIVGCVYFHIDTLMPQKSTTIATEIPKPQDLEAVEPIEENSAEAPMSEKLTQDDTAVQDKVEELEDIEKVEEVVEKIEPIQAKEQLPSNNPTTAQPSEKTIETPQKKVVLTPEITDQKVKVLFDKKREQKEQNVQKEPAKELLSQPVEIDYKKIEQEIAALVKENRIIFKRLSTDVADDSKITLEKIAQILKQYPLIKIEVGGHTDAKGDKEVNEYISKHRALSVKKLLVQYGVEKERLSAVGYGESRPIVENDPQGYSILNRRVEFKVIKD